MEKINLESICQKLQVADRRCKIAAFEELQKYCENPKTSANEILAAFDECYLYLLKCYSDRYESVRDQAAHTVSQFLERLPSNDFHVANIMSTLHERMGLDETVEESEEIRLMYVQQLHSLIARCPIGNDRFIEESHDHLRQILKKSIRDAHPAVQREACAAIVTLGTLFSNSPKLQSLADTLSKSLYCILGHKHSLVRIGAIQALARLALLIDCSGDAFSRLIMEVSPLLMDLMPLVRRVCGQMGILLLMEHKDRYSYFDRIIPLVLCCLKDESPEVVAFITPLWVKCGQQYFEENEVELSKQEIGDIKPENYPDSVERPTIGCRALVQRSLRLLTLITRESANWKDNVRLHSLRLLYQFVLHAEAAMTAKFFEIYQDIARACRDHDYNIAKEAMKVADLMGRVFSYDDWFDHGFEGLTKNAREGYLKCFYAMYNATSRADIQHVHRIAKTLVHPDFSQTLKPDFQKYVIKLTEVLIEKSENAKKDEKYDEDFIEQINRNLYVITIKVLALSQCVDSGKASELHERAENAFQRLSERLCITIDKLHEKYLADALQYVQNLDAPLDGLSEPILLLNGLINIAKFRAPYLEEIQRKINAIWQYCSSEAKIKVFSIISMEMLKWQETIGTNLREESASLLKNFLKSVVEEHLSWKAGATAEAMRSLAIATLCAASQGAPKEAQLVLPEFARYIPSLLEDHSVSTRHYAIKCVANIGEVPLADLKPIAYATLQRLDDPSSDIRVLAATTITKMHPKFERGTDGEYDREIWDIFLKKALDVLFIHYEGPDLRLKDVIRGTIMEFACDHPSIVSECFKRANEQAVNNSVNLEELQKQLPNLIFED